MDVRKVITNPREAKAFAREGRKRIEEARKQPEVQPLLGRFRSPRGYEGWDDHVLMSWIIGLGVRMNPSLLLNTDKSGAGAMAALIAHLALQEDAPPRYLGRRLAEAFLHTEIPRLETPPELALPCYRLFLPKGLLRNEHDIGINAIIATDRQLLSRLFREEAGGGDSEDAPGLCCLMHTISGESYFFDHLWTDPDKALSANNGTPEAAKQAIHRAAHLVTHATLTMATMPELIVVDDPKIVTAGRGFVRGSSDPQPSPPTWIGREFRAHVVQPIIRKGQPGPSAGLQVRPHWRQGHWRAVACGPRWKDHRLKWIQPCFVGKHTLINS